MRQVMVVDYLHRDGKWQIIDKGVALFHAFGLDYEEFESGHAGFSTAIVEWPDGKVEMVRADRIRFLTPLEADGPLITDRAAIAKATGGEV